MFEDVGTEGCEEIGFLRIHTAGCLPLVLRNYYHEGASPLRSRKDGLTALPTCARVVAPSLIPPRNYSTRSRIFDALRTPATNRATA